MILWILRALGWGLNQNARVFYIRAFSGCYAILKSYNNSETAVYGYNSALFWVLSVSCCCLAESVFTYYDQHCSILLAEFKISILSSPGWQAGRQQKWEAAWAAKRTNPHSNSAFLPKRWLRSKAVAINSAIERLRFTCTPNSTREFVPRD